MFYFVVLLVICVVVLIFLLRNMLVIKYKKEKEEDLKKCIFKIAHEIKNPLAVCKGYFSMMNLDNKEKSEKYLRVIEEEMNRTILLLDDYLNYNDIEVNLDVMDLTLLLDDVSFCFSSFFLENNVSYKFLCDEDEIFILGDYDRLKQVFMNLFKNSVEARKSDSELYIDLKINLFEDKVEVVLKDNGIGMDSSVVSRIGEDFFTTKLCGTGLGVSISKEIIKKHHGSLEYVSNEGYGTSTILSFPLHESF